MLLIVSGCHHHMWQNKHSMSPMSPMMVRPSMTTRMKCSMNNMAVSDRRVFLYHHLAHLVCMIAGIVVFRRGGVCLSKMHPIRIHLFLHGDMRQSGIGCRFDCYRFLMRSEHPDHKLQSNLSTKGPMSPRMVKPSMTTRMCHTRRRALSIGPMTY